MFTRVHQPALSEAELFAALHPELSRWFRQHRAPAQAVAVPEILAGKSLLLSSPTGSGKTLAAFLVVFDHLAKARDRDGPALVSLRGAEDGLAADLGHRLRDE